MDFGIAGKTAFVTGGSKGMGREVARMLAGEGCRVAIVARGKPDIDDAVAAIARAGGTALGVAADITRREDVDRAVAEVSAAFGPPLIVIGQTKHAVPGDFTDITNDADFMESFHVYTMSQVYLLRAVLPGMRAAGWGRFVHIGSATAKEPQGSIHHALANTTRPSTIGLLKTVSDEFAQYGITINTVAPGWIATENAYDYLKTNLGIESDEARREFMRKEVRVPAARMGKPDEIASLIVYLCSQLAGYVTGNWIEVDGGQHRSAF